MVSEALTQMYWKGDVYVYEDIMKQLCTRVNDYISSYGPTLQYIRGVAIFQFFSSSTHI